MSGLAAAAAVTPVVGQAEDAPKQTAAQKAAERQGLALFEKKIRPALVDHCYKCHSMEAGEGKVKGGLLVDSRAGLRTGGETGPAVVPGSPEDSLLLDALKHDGLEMPPGKKLSDELIADFTTWIKLGAPDPREGGTTVARPAIDLVEGRKFWAFQPPARHPAPKVEDAAWARTDVDRFVLAQLESQKIKPVKDADRATLARRLSFDLVGLPPTPEQLDELLKDKSPKAIERFVDRLLDSPQFGERWGRHWLDVARYAESNGNTDNVTYPHAWRYRDYVIDAFNEDRSFQQFILEQLAGDLLDTKSPELRDRNVIATGFLALGSKPRSQNNPDFQMDVVAEQIEVTTSGFMGLTVACARCHDHKFDPIPTTEYYALAGVFTSTQALYSGGGGRGNGRLANTGFHQLTGGGAAVAEREKRERELSESRDSLTAVIKELTDAGAFGATSVEVASSSGAAPSVDTSKLTKKQLAALEKRLAEKNQAATKAKAREAKLAAKQAARADAKKQAELDADPVAKLKTARVPEGAPAALKKQIESLIAKGETAAGRIESLEAALKAPSELLAMGVRDAKKPADCALCIRGESQKRGDVIPRAFVSVVTNGPTKIETDGSGRLELARWIASSENPLTARVIVNRVWQHLFGRGIVPSVDNFGALGEKPSHPELLDHLALQFVADGWSIKRLIRSLVLTRTYGLSSDHDAAAYEKDPDNVLQWRHAPRRLEGEVLRDAMLAVSGHLSLERPVGSPIAKLGEETINDAKRKGDQFVDGSARCRSVYLPAVRNRLPEVLDLFDAPDPSLLVGLRDVTTVPAQSLFLMNSPLVIEQSRKFAQRVIASSEKSADRVRQAFRIALGRDATATEIDRCLALLDKVQVKIKTETKASDDAELRGWSAICQSLYASAEFRYVE